MPPQLETPTTKPDERMRPGPLKLDSHMPLGQALLLMARQGLHDIEASQAGVLRLADPEPVHQMRVGMRRLRTATGLLARWAPCPPTLRSELAWLDGELGAARDAEVLAHQALPSLTLACPQEPGLTHLLRRATAIAKAKRRHAATVLKSVRHQRLMHLLKGWLTTLGDDSATRDPAPEALTRPLARQRKVVVALRRRKLSQRCLALDQDDPASRHRLRIAVKQARYTFDFFQSMKSGRSLEKDLKHLEVLQDTLGRLNDVAVAGHLLQDMARHHPELGDSAAFARGFFTGGAIPDAQALKRLSRRFASKD